MPSHKHTHLCTCAFHPTNFIHTAFIFFLLVLQQTSPTYQELTHQFVPALYDNNTVTGGMTEGREGGGGSGGGGGGGGGEREGGEGGSGGGKGDEGDFYEEMRGRGQNVEHNFSAHLQAPPLYVNNNQVGGGRKGGGEEGGGGGGGGGDTNVYDEPGNYGMATSSKQCNYSYSVVKKPSIKN